MTRRARTLHRLRLWNRGNANPLPVAEVVDLVDVVDELMDAEVPHTIASTMTRLGTELEAAGDDPYSRELRLIDDAGQAWIARPAKIGWSLLSGGSLITPARTSVVMVRGLRLARAREEEPADPASAISRV